MVRVLVALSLPLMWLLLWLAPAPLLLVSVGSPTRDEGPRDISKAQWTRKLVALMDRGPAKADNAQAIELGSLIRSEIDGEEVTLFVITLQSGDYQVDAISERELDLLVLVWHQDPDGSWSHVGEEANGLTWRSTIHAEGPGTYYIGVADTNGGSGTYGLLVQRN